MRIARNLLLIILALFLQSSWVSKIGIYEITPDVVLLVLVYIGITAGQIEGTIFGFFSGFLLDIYSPETMGVNSLANSLVGFAVGYSRIGVVAEDLQVQALIIFLATLLHDTIFFFLYAISDIANMFYLIFRHGIGTALYTACLGAGLSFITARFWRQRQTHA